MLFIGIPIGRSLMISSEFAECFAGRALQCVSQMLGEMSVVLRFDGLLELFEELPGDQAHVALEKSSLACTCSCRSSDINEIKCSKQAWSTPWYLIMATSAPK